MITIVPDLTVPTSCKALHELQFVKRIPPRRALFQLGPNDAKLNMEITEKLLTISAENFVKKWNFDPIKMRPMQGRFVWTALKQDPTEESPATEEVRNIAHTLHPTVLTCPTLSKTEKSDVPVHSTPRKTPSKALRKPKSRKLSDKKSLPSKSRQTKITEYGRQRKRLYSNCKTDDEDDLTSPSKRALLASLSPTSK